MAQPAEPLEALVAATLATAAPGLGPAAGLAAVLALGADRKSVV